MKQLFVIVTIALFAVSCKSSKKNNDAVSEKNSENILSNESVKTKSTAENQRAVQEIAAAHYGLFNDFNTLKINANVDYTGQEGSYSPSADIQIEKNKRILIAVKALGIPLAKVYLTPERATYYEVLGGTYYDGDYQFIKDFLGTEVTYENVENLLLGKAFYDLNTNDYIKTKNNELELKLNQFLMRLVMGGKNQIASTEVTQDKNADKLVIQYPSYQLNENIYLPKEINIHAMQKNDVQIKIDYRRVSVNPSLDFRYKIPNNSKPIKI